MEEYSEENVAYSIETLLEVLSNFPVKMRKERLQSCIDILETELAEIDE